MDFNYIYKNTLTQIHIWLNGDCSLAKWTFHHTHQHLSPSLFGLLF